MTGKIASKVKPAPGGKMLFRQHKDSFSNLWLWLLLQNAMTLSLMCYVFTTMCVSCKDERLPYGVLIPPAICFFSIDSDVSPYQKQMHWLKIFPPMNQIRNEHFDELFHRGYVFAWRKCHPELNVRDGVAMRESAKLIFQGNYSSKEG